LAVADGCGSVGFYFLRMAVCDVRSEDNSGELAQIGTFGGGRNGNRLDELVGKETEEGHVKNGFHCVPSPIVTEATMKLTGLPYTKHAQAFNIHDDERMHVTSCLLWRRLEHV
jgi:hypothetical protein